MLPLIHSTEAVKQYARGESLVLRPTVKCGCAPVHALRALATTATGQPKLAWTCMQAMTRPVLGVGPYFKGGLLLDPRLMTTVHVPHNYGLSAWKRNIQRRMFQATTDATAALAARQWR